jgi:hypothetical protein
MPDTIPEINFTLDPSDTIPAPVDPSLSIEGMAADAKATGDALAAKLDTYSELEALEALESTDEIPVGRGGVGAKIDYDALAEAILDRIGAGSLSASPSLLVNLAAATAADVMQASPRPGVTGVLPIANGGTGGDTAVAARAALDVTGVDIPLATETVTLAPGTVQVSSGGGFANYKYVDLYFDIQGGQTAAMRIRPNYAEKRYKLGFFAWNDTDSKLRRMVLNFTTAGRYFTDVVVKMSYDGEAFADNSQILQLVKAVGYAW